MVELAKSFRRLTAPGTRRKAIQLTSGPKHCWPMYYFIPSFSSDERYLVYHCLQNGAVQLHRLDLTSGKSVQLTHAIYPRQQWPLWQTENGEGTLDHRSVVNAARNEAIYFDGAVTGNTVHAVNILTLDRVLFTIPEDRLATGQNCASPDGKWFFYIHHDKALWEAIYGGENRSLYGYPRHLSRDTRLAGINLETGEQRTLLIVDAPIHHIQPAGDRHLAFSSLASRPTILYTDYGGGWYTHLRTRTDDGGNTCHYCVTERGIAYEATGGPYGMVGGIVSPETHNVVEFRLPSDVQRGHGGHVGFDPRGRRFFYERNAERLNDVHDIVFLRRHVPGADEWMPLTGNWPNYGSGQKKHFHPRLVLGGQWFLITAGDPSTETTHLFLLDASDLPESEGIDI